MKIYKEIILITVVLILMSCSKPNTVNRQLNAHINKVELEYQHYSAQDWEEANAEFEKLLSHFEANYENMSVAEREATLQAIGRYYGLAAKQGIQEAAKGVQDAAKELQEALEVLPSFIDGFTEAFN